MNQSEFEAITSSLFKERENAPGLITIFIGCKNWLKIFDPITKA